jgi:hypothetical protein
MVLNQNTYFSKRFLGVTLIGALIFNCYLNPQTASARSLLKAKNVSCGSVKPSLVSIVNTQMSAFRLKNFPKAYSVTSNLFKSKFSLKNFSELIQSYYPFLISNTRVVPGVCMSSGNQASLIFRIYDKNNDVYDLNYKFGRSSGRWAIDGAALISNGDLSGI